MKTENYIILIFVFLLNACNTENQKVGDNNSTTQEEPSLSLKPPGLVPELFDEDAFLQKGYALTGEFHPAMQEFYFNTTRIRTAFTIRKIAAMDFFNLSCLFILYIIITINDVCTF